MRGAHPAGQQGPFHGLCDEPASAVTSAPEKGSFSPAPWRSRGLLLPLPGVSIILCWLQRGQLKALGLESLVSLPSRVVSGSGLQTRPAVTAGVTRTESPRLRGHLASLGAGARGARGSSRAGRVSRGCTTPWPGRCARGGGGTAT